MMFRNNGIYLIILTFPCLLFIKNFDLKKVLLVFLLSCSLYLTYDKVLLPALKITPTSVREKLSIPFQQTARYVKYYADRLSQEDIEVIDKILEFGDLADRYDPELSDPVKNQFNKYATDEDIKKYFKVWFTGLIDKPVIYLDATLENTYGYFYPAKLDWYLYYKYDSRLSQAGFNYHYNNLTSARDMLAKLGTSLQKFPIIGLITNIAFNNWLVFIAIGYLIYKKVYKNIVVFMPALVTMLVCIAGPVNTYYRYALPVIISVPFLLSVVYNSGHRGVYK